MSDGVRRKKKGTKKRSSSLPIGLIIGAVVGVIVLGGAATVGGIVAFRAMQGTPVASGSNVAASANPIGSDTPSTPVSSIYLPVSGPGAQPLVTTYGDESSRFQIQLPEGWTKTQDKFFRAKPPNEKSEGVQMENVTIMIHQVPDATIGSTVKRYFAIFQDPPKPKEDVSARVGDLDARRLVIETTDGQGELFKPFCTVLYFIGPVNNCVFQMDYAYHLENKEKYLETMEAIVASFRAPATP